jgi:hypothetical protein
MLAWLAALSLAAWLYLVVLHGQFWRCSERLPAGGPARRHGWGRGSRWKGRDYGRQEVAG